MMALQHTVFAHVSLCRRPVLNIHGDARKNKTIDRLSQETRDIPPPPPPPPPSLHGTSYILHLTLSCLAAVPWTRSRSDIFMSCDISRCPLWSRPIICWVFIVIFSGGSRLALMCHNECGDPYADKCPGWDQTDGLLRDNVNDGKWGKIIIQKNCKELKWMQEIQKVESFPSPYWRCQNV